MSWLVTRQFTFFLLLTYGSLAAGQMKGIDPFLFDSDAIVLPEGASESRIVREVPNLQLSMEKWAHGNQMMARLLGIIHKPQDDFNVYLSVNHLLTPNIRTSMEVSLNYAGQMNFRNIIVLRKKAK